MTQSVNWKEGEEYLVEVDKVFVPLVEKYGSCTLKPIEPGKYYSILLKGIISQQESPEVAHKSFKHFLCIFGEQPNVEKIITATEDDFFACGLNKYKISYIMDLSTKILEKELKLDEFVEMKDEEIIRKISKIKGFGRWTAEMFLILAMNRPNIIPTDDYGLQKGLKNIMELPNMLTKRSEINAIADKWRPWRSLATWYLWQHN